MRITVFFLILLLIGCDDNSSDSQNTNVQPSEEGQALESENNISLNEADVAKEEALAENTTEQEDESKEAITEENSYIAVDVPSNEAVQVTTETLNQNPSNKDINGEQKIDEQTQHSNNQSLEIPAYFYIMFVLIIAALICLAITTYFLAKEVRWRKRHSDSKSLVFPDAHLDILDDLKHAWENLYKEINEFSNLGLSNQKDNEALANKTMESISKFNSTIDAQQEEINRLKEGYDFSIKKHSAVAVIEINDLVEGYLNEDLNDQAKEKLSKIDGYVKSNLEDLDIEEFTFDAGLSIRDLSSDEFEIDSVENTSENEMHEKVKETTRKGYAFIHENGKNIIRKAKIKVYRKEN